MTVEDIIREYEPKMELTEIVAEVYDCRITCRDRETREELGMTVRHLGKEPGLAQLLTLLAIAALEHENSKLQREPGQSRGARSDAASFERWCFLYGHDEKSPEIHNSYVAMRKRSEQLRYVLGDEAYQQLLEAVK